MFVEQQSVVIHGTECNSSDQFEVERALRSMEAPDKRWETYFFGKDNIRVRPRVGRAWQLCALRGCER